MCIRDRLNGNYDQETKNTILEVQQNNPEELADAFYRDLEFGTGGLRGLMGVGTNRVNKYTIGTVSYTHLDVYKRQI